MSNKIREEFEAWFNEIGSLAVLADTLKDADGNYYFSETRLLWSSWQASRQALVVELPEPEWAEQDDYKELVKERLDNAGIKWKE